jgi:hypothetical protein
MGLKAEDILELAKEALANKDNNQATDILTIINGNSKLFKNDKLANDLKQALEMLLGEKLVKAAEENVTVYDFSKFENHKTSWYELWDKKKYPDFASFFYHYILPTFHKVPEQSVQHPIMACFALMNVASIPVEGKKPNGICCGFSRTGKSKFAERISQLLPKRSSAIIKGNSSPLAITQAIHKVCYLGGDIYDFLVRPSVTKFDNIYWDDFISRIADHYVTLLALEKGDAICEIAGKNGGTYHTFSKYVFTTVQPPIRNNPRMDELLNRSCVFYFDKGFEPEIEPSLYSWDGFDKEYMTLWSKEPVENLFFKDLSDAMKVKKSDTCMSLERLEISRILIATGIFCEIFPDIPSALRAFEEYYQYCDLKQENVGNLLYKLTSNYLDEHYYKKEKLKHLSIKNYTPTSEPISFVHLANELESISHGVIRLNQKNTAEVEEIMLQHDFVLLQNHFGLEFVHRSFITGGKNND